MSSEPGDSRVRDRTQADIVDAVDEIDRAPYGARVRRRLSQLPSSLRYYFRP